MTFVPHEPVSYDGGPTPHTQNKGTYIVNEQNSRIIQSSVDCVHLSSQNTCQLKCPTYQTYTMVTSSGRWLGHDINTERRQILVFILYI